MDDNLHWCGQNNAMFTIPQSSPFLKVVWLPFCNMGSLLLFYPHYPIINHDKPLLSHDYALDYAFPSLTFIMVDLTIIDPH